MQEEDYKKIIAELDSRCKYLEKVILDQALIIESQAERITKLEEEIRILKNGNNSRNSSMAPSRDIFKPNRNNPNRIKSNKKPGGQFGHDGSFLKFKSEVDEIIIHDIDRCQYCDHSLKEVDSNPGYRGQIIDIPQIEMKVTEHQSLKKICPCCQKLNTSQLPGTLSYSGVQYGERLRELIVMLSARQYIRIQTLQETIQAITVEKVSTGFISSCIERKASQFEPIYDEILNKVLEGKYMQSDESGIKIKDQKGWMWTWKNMAYTYFKASNNRGYDTISSVIGDEELDIVLVSDRYPAQLKTHAKEHQICLVHVIRECNKFVENYASSWAAKLKAILQEIIELRKGKKICNLKKQDIEFRLETHLNSDEDQAYKKVQTLKKQLAKIRRYITTTLYHPGVPAHNNSCEQSIRNVKLKTKISTNFRSYKGAQNYAIIRSVIDSDISQGKDVLEVIKNPYLIFS